MNAADFCSNATRSFAFMVSFNGRTARQLKEFSLTFNVIFTKAELQDTVFGDRSPSLIFSQTLYCMLVQGLNFGSQGRNQFYNSDIFRIEEKSNRKVVQPLTVKY